MSAFEIAWLWALTATLAWGVAAFGANYVWASTPLMTASFGIGICGMWSARSRSVYQGLVVSALLLALCIAAQIVPIQSSWLNTLSPSTAEVLVQHDLAYALAPESSHATSIDPRKTVIGLAFYVALITLLFGSAMMMTRRLCIALTYHIAFLGVVVAITGIVQRVVSPLEIYGFWQPLQEARPFGPFVNRNHFAGWMLMAIPLTLGSTASVVSRNASALTNWRVGFEWLGTKSASTVLLQTFAVITMGASMILTWSRSGMVALTAVLGISAVFAMRRAHSRSGRTTVAAYFFVLALLPLWFGMDRIIARFSSPDLIDGGGRFAIWQDTIEIAKRFWLTGSGLNTYDTSTLYLQTALPEVHVKEAHSDYLQLLSEGGILLGIPVVLVIITFVIATRRRFQDDQGSIWWIRIGAVTGLLGIALQSAGEFSLQMPGNAVFFVALAAVALHDSRQ